MKLTADALKLINNKRTRARLALALDKSDQTIIRYIDDNDDNLTKAAALEIIRQDTKMTDEAILEPAEVS